MRREGLEAFRKDSVPRLGCTAWAVFPIYYEVAKPLSKVEGSRLQNSPHSPPLTMAVRSC